MCWWYIFQFTIKDDVISQCLCHTNLMNFTQYPHISGPNTTSWCYRKHGTMATSSLQGRHNEHAGVSNDQRLNCLLISSGSGQRKHQSSSSLSFVGEFAGHRGIPHTKGQKRGKCFRLMTPSCFAWKMLLPLVRICRFWTGDPFTNIDWF